MKKRITPDRSLPVTDKKMEAMRWVDGTSNLLDAKYRIPGTRIRFGLDFLMGLVPGAGDAVSLGFSGLLIATMAKNGASLRLILLMLGNVILDAVVGAVPILGNLFDLVFRANIRNARLMREHYEQGKHHAHPWPILLGIAILVVSVFAGLLVLLALAARTLVGWIS
ncbi:DUF4112 domain-containing protein [Allorhodopirellula heiligendammensis]|uniref:DUF4112 domain-containing protein n=1 Tax=Allorhodopirellula heiligendammensis TaxID=2714739 RepID=A0A5C6C1C3_9BACT|nr:DUF4112 domain-containing protein [Allorhodopirellula heiligendammensis]TWU16649.1 hypothetical protein Poly21_38540 [Allorhodopirellula heiligendammensis]|tara:strand:+ start:502 stop:1002 length:501 start_codon:yes stop_codon:yes gene_type:complete